MIRIQKVKRKDWFSKLKHHEVVRRKPRDSASNRIYPNVFEGKL